MVHNPVNPHILAFPSSFEWLLQHQATDGSWSGPGSYALLPTIAALLALLRAPEQTEQIGLAISRAEKYLHQALEHWSVKNHESVGFEILAPCLMKELEDLGVIFEFADKDELYKLSIEKLLIGGPELIYSGQSNLIHSLEAFGSQLDFQRLKSQQADNGSYGCSPAATAAVLIYSPEWDQKAADWLVHLSNQSFEGESGGMPNAYAIDTFEASWVIYNLAQSFDVKKSFPNETVEEILQWLRLSLGTQGASINRFLGMPSDSDDTGMVLAALNLAGENVSVASLSHFERDDHFACFELERGISISANAHVLAALLSIPKSEQQEWDDEIKKVVNFLYSVRNSRGFWGDKWHLSPYYSTVCCALAIATSDNESYRANLKQTIEWVLDTQSSRDGGWGWGDFSTMEETAYALQILQATPDLIEPSQTSRYQKALQKGTDYLWQSYSDYKSQNRQLPKLWRGKELYTPTTVVISAILSALAH